MADASRRTWLAGGAAALAALHAFAARAQDPSDPQAMRRFLSGLAGEVRFGAARDDAASHELMLDLGGVEAVAAFTASFGERPPQDHLLALAQNLDASEPTRVVAIDPANGENRPLSVGPLAFLVLTSLVYHEEVDEAGDLVPWPGYLPEYPQLQPRLPSLSSDLEQALAPAAARQAWLTAIAAGAYCYL